MANIVMGIVTWLCAAVFLGIGLYTLKSKKPMHFYAGTEVKKEEITDVKGYNKANGIMWLTYGVIIFAVGIVGFLGFTDLCGILTMVVTLGGVPLLILVYSRIYKKYRKQ